MQSLQQLLYLALYFYLGSFTHITYDTIFFYQKKLLLIKHIIFFSFIAFLWISIANKFSIQMIYIYYIIFIVGYTISYKIFHRCIANITLQKHTKTAIIRKYNFAKYICLPKKKTALLSSGDKSATQNDCRQKPAGTLRSAPPHPLGRQNTGA